MSHLISTINFWLLDWAATYSILGKHSTRIPLARCASLCVPEMFWNNPIFVPMHRSVEGFRKSSQSTTQNPKRCRTSCAEDWWFFCHQFMTDISMNNLPNQLFSLHRSHLVRTPILQMCRTSVSLWHLLYFWWNANCLSNSSPWIQMLVM